MAYRCFYFLLTIVLVLLFSARAWAADKLKVLVPDRENLQYMSFWVAKGGGFFEREGLDVELVVPKTPAAAEAMFAEGAADAAVLPPPMYLRLVADRKPIVIVASLLRNDASVVVVRREVLEARKLTPEMPLRDRVRGLAGMKVGVAPHLPGRLRALLATQGLDADKDIEQTVLLGKLQNPAFHDKKVDALYVHTPYVEKAIVEDDAVVLIDPARGEVKELATSLIHGFVFTRAAHDARRPAVMAAVRAIAEAQKSIHASQESAVSALAREHPSRPRKELEALVRIYEPAIPETPDVKTGDLAPALELFPEGVPRPDLAGIDLAPFVASDVAGKVRQEEGGRRTQWIVGAVALVVLVAGAIALRGRKSRTSS